MEKGGFCFNSEFGFLAMPSVGMRRNTRVFGARVLRSGRKLWTGKHSKTGDGEDWVGLLDDSVNGGGDAVQSKENGVRQGEDVALKGDESVDFGNGEEDSREPDDDVVEIGQNVDKMWGAFYTRKRKRVKNSKVSSSSADRMYGKQFSRKHCRKRIRGDINSDFSSVCGLIVESSSGSFWLSCFLSSVLRYIRRFRVTMDQISSFLSSESIDLVLSSHGVRFLKDCSSSSLTQGECRIYDTGCSVLSFSVHISAVPSSFMLLHSTLHLRFALCFNNHVNYPVSAKVHRYKMIIDEYTKFRNMNSDQMVLDDHQPPVTFCEDQPVNITKPSENKHSKSDTIATPKLPEKSLQLRCAITSRTIQKKRRSSLRSKRSSKNYSAFGIPTANRALVNDLFLDKQGRIPFTPLPSNRVINTPVQKNLKTNFKEVKSSVLGLTNDFDVSSCSANLLIIESDKGYREEGAVIKLEPSSSNQWFLSVTRDGSTRYSLKPQIIERPFSCNRFSHAIIWKDEGCNGWMLEFYNRQDWVVFKELHRKGSDRNFRIPAHVDAIPVPVVRDVPGYADNVSTPFERPHSSYISGKDDEVTRVLSSGKVIYDMDLDDEDWLNKFNNELSIGNEFVSMDSFEKIIFAFERGLYCSPDEYSDPKSAVDLCADLERREVLEAVHSYWLKKRKQRRSALVRVFQQFNNQSKRAQLLPKAVLRKKRSSKRLARCSTGRGKRHIFLKAMLAEQNKPDVESSLLKVQEAKAAAVRFEESAIQKRQRAQLLMQTAELATYKATMALRIAKAAQLSDSPENAASFFLLD